LAGSVLTLDRAVRNMRDFVSLPVAEAIGMATWNPARLMGVDDRKGRLQAGCDADLVILDDELKVRQVWTRGQPV
jgi:N-acetylglucosamine-6-phosphate deacetylase